MICRGSDIHGNHTCLTLQRCKLHEPHETLLLHMIFKSGSSMKIRRITLYTDDAVVVKQYDIPQQNVQEDGEVTLDVPIAFP